MYRLCSLSVVLLLLSANSARATIWNWPPCKRPIVLLDDALALAHEALESSKLPIQFCESVSLVDTGTWTLTFPVRDGSELFVSVDAKKRVKWEQWFPEREEGRPAEASPAPRTFDELRAALTAFAAQASPEMKIENGEGQLTLSYRTQPVSIYPAQEDGEFAHRLEQDACPLPGGLWFRISETDHVDWGDSFHWMCSGGWPYYWCSSRDTRYMTQSNHCLAVEWRTSATFGGLWKRNLSAELANDDLLYRPSDETERSTKRLALGIQRLLGPTTGWSWRNAPPISLRNAIKIAKTKLGEEAATRYCFDIRLWGDLRGDQRFGSWLLYFPAEDGTQKLVTVYMDGRSTVEDWPLYETREERKRLPRFLATTTATVDSLDDARDRLLALFAQQGVRVNVRLEGDRLTASYKTRTLRVHPWIFSADSHERKAADFGFLSPGERGKPGSELLDEVGPVSDGFCLEVRLHEYDPDPPSFGFLFRGTLREPEPYWYRSQVILPASGQGPSLLVTFRSGKSPHTSVPAHRIVDVLTRKE